LTNESGFKGVCKSYGKYAVGVKENGVGIHLGTFATPEEAAFTEPAAASSPAPAVATPDAAATPSP
jgi:hypothetical protein